MAVHLRFRSLTVTTADAEKTYCFDGPATVVSGPSGTGKSSLLMLLKHVVGGKAVLTPAVRDHVISARAEVFIGEQHVILKRTVNDARSGQVEVLDPGTLATRNIYAVQADGDLPPLSDYLLAALDFPRETIPASRDGKATTRDLTFTDLFAYVYREARNIDREVVGHLDTWFKTKRTALFKLMFALTDSTVLELSRKLGELKEELRKKTDEYENVKNFLGATDPRTEDQLRAELTSLRDMLQRADAALASLRHGLEESTAADAASFAKTCVRQWTVPATPRRTSLRQKSSWRPVPRSSPKSSSTWPDSTAPPPPLRSCHPSTSLSAHVACSASVPAPYPRTTARSAFRTTRTTKTSMPPLSHRPEGTLTSSFRTPEPCSKPIALSWKPHNNEPSKPTSSPAVCAVNSTHRPATSWHPASTPSQTPVPARPPSGQPSTP
ncbi:hypothetical protein [Streptomyces sp. NPDC050848]|uniref:hypothetical protein n=1 Tax=Streptomyces sp. NPDC050848 TaxID=3155791 RepID=UPI0033C97F29